MNKQIPLINSSKVIYSLFDFSGNWSKPYRENGYDVRQIDIKHGDDIRWLEIPKEPVYGILAAPPCTHFTVSCNQYWDDKDNDGRTLTGLELVSAAMRFILATNPIFWVLENPVGRLYKWIGDPVFSFDPCDFGDPYTKRTLLWGNFNTPKKQPIKPIECRPGHHSIDEYYGIKSNFKNRAELRSVTPPGFAQAFYEVNK